MRDVDVPVDVEVWMGCAVVSVVFWYFSGGGTGVDSFDSGSGSVGCVAVMSVSDLDRKYLSTSVRQGRFVADEPGRSSRRLLAMSSTARIRAWSSGPPSWSGE